MNSRRLAAACVMALTTFAAGGVRAQQDEKPDPSPAPSTVAEESTRRQQQEQLARRVAALNDKTPLQVQVTVSRYTGVKKISSMPYVLTVNAGGTQQELGRAENSRLRMGSQVPVSGPVLTNGKQLQSFTYQEIGTNIDCRARSMGDGRFELGISVEEKSIFTDVKDDSVPAAQQVPVVRSFQTSQNLILRDGQSRQFTAATDRVSGEVVRIDVTLSVVK